MPSSAAVTCGSLIVPGCWGAMRCANEAGVFSAMSREPQLAQASLLAGRSAATGMSARNNAGSSSASASSSSSAAHYTPSSNKLGARRPTRLFVSPLQLDNRPSRSRAEGTDEDGMPLIGQFHPATPGSCLDDDGFDMFGAQREGGFCGDCTNSCNMATTPGFGTRARTTWSTPERTNVLAVPTPIVHLSGAVAAVHAAPQKNGTTPTGEIPQIGLPDQRDRAP
ncbi:unnamed protein product [Amoebophrya sp. A120]|nr:unnamed protein product [Amoebophrya sp. A120]|eukprot:GSA120T00013065001.1